jgi:hypothetical protein
MYCLYKGNTHTGQYIHLYGPSLNVPKKILMKFDMGVSTFKVITAGSYWANSTHTCTHAHTQDSSCKNLVHDTEYWKLRSTFLYKTFSIWRIFKDMENMTQQSYINNKWTSQQTKCEKQQAMMICISYTDTYISVLVWPVWIHKFIVTTEDNHWATSSLPV